MSKQSDEFEKMTTRIFSMLEGSNSKVTWNDKIPDPDNPNQLRQIDISIINSSSTTYVECRIHESKQDVKWIEELHGRKESLGADAIIAVSSSGFTKGAIKKANRFGIALRDTVSLKKEDMFSWGKIEYLRNRYFVFEEFRINLLFSSEEECLSVSVDDLKNAIDKQENFANKIYDSVPVQSFLKRFENDKDLKKRYISQGRFVEPIYVNNIKVTHFQQEITNLRLVEDLIPIKMSLLFGDTDNDKSIGIYKLDNDRGDIIGYPGKIRLTLFNPGYHAPENSLFCSMDYKLTLNFPSVFEFGEDISNAVNSKKAFRNSLLIGVGYITGVGYMKRSE
jgi:hypothetical protein